MIQRPVKWCLNLSPPLILPSALSLFFSPPLIYASLARFHSSASSRYTALERWSHQLRTSRTMLPVARNGRSDFLAFRRSIIDILPSRPFLSQCLRIEMYVLRQKRLRFKIEKKLFYLFIYCRTLILLHIIYRCALMHNDIRPSCTRIKLSFAIVI